MSASLSDFLSQNLMLVALFFVSGSMLLWPTFAKLLGAGGSELGTLETTRLMNSGTALVLDIRDNAEFNNGRIPKSKNIPLAEIATRHAEIAKFKDKPVIVTGGTNNRAPAAIRTLKANGFTDVHALQGGFSAWQQASLPVEK